MSRISLILSIILSTISVFQLKSQSNLSNSSEVSLLTCEQGEELYSIFGHSAIRIQDSINNVDRVYNYGTFDFNTPNFYLKFSRGNLDYMLSVAKLNNFLPQYFYENRGVTEQVLDLDLSQRNRLYNILNTNALLQNRSYRYDFFFDNCATRLRDVIYSSVDSLIMFDKNMMPESYRDLYGNYLKDSPWTKLGIHMLLGIKADKKSSYWNSMYLPDYLSAEISKATLIDSVGNKKALVKETRVIFESTPNLQPNNYRLLSPVKVFGFLWLLILAITIFEILRGKKYYSIDYTFFGVSFIISLFLCYLWFFTFHTITKLNLNLLWASPLSLLIMVGLIRNGVKALWFKTTLILYSSGLVLMALIFLLYPSFFSPSIIFIVLIYLTRSVRHILLIKFQ